MQLRRYALVRRPGASLVRGLTSHPELGVPDWQLALAQHGAYVRALEQAGLQVTVLPAQEEFPDCTFVEDTAVITERGAIITRPGAKERLGEPAAIRGELAKHMPVVELPSPTATVDGGDVMRVGAQFYIGISSRTNRQGAEVLADQLRDWGYHAEFIQVGRDLHLKTSVNYLGDQRLLATAAFANHPAFQNFHIDVLDRDEDYAANTLAINGRLIMPAGFPRLKARLATRGMPVVEVDVSEFRKVDGGLSCLSLLY